MFYTLQVDKIMSKKIIYRNRLPHIAPIGATFFVTFRLGDSLPSHLVKQWRSEMDVNIKKIKEDKPYGYKQKIHKQRVIFFKNYDQQLDHFPYGECYLKDQRIADIVQKKLRELHGRVYHLICNCIMPNHVHFLIDTSVQLSGDEKEFIQNEVPENYIQLDDIMKDIKGHTAFQSNRILNRTGKFWQKDSFDHYVRNERELNNIINYILQNPVKARLIDKWEDYSYTYLNSKWLREMNLEGEFSE